MRCLRAASNGVGLVYTIEPLVRMHLAAATLVSVLDAFLPLYDGFCLYYVSRAQFAAKLRVFADFLGE